MRGDLPAGGWGAQGWAAWQCWPCSVGLSGMLPAEVRAWSQLPVGWMAIHDPWGGEGRLQVPQWLWGASGFQLSSRERVWFRPGARSWDLESPCVAASVGRYSMLGFLLHACLTEDCR